MHQIDVDFEVFKALTALRSAEDVSYNDVIRGLLDLEIRPLADEAAVSIGEEWVVKGIRFKQGTQFRAKYKGLMYLGEVIRGALVLKGKRYTSPSAAAVSITGNPVNGWTFWEFRKGFSWVPMSSARSME